MSQILAAIERGLIVSCQAYPGEPMRDPRTMAQIAQAAVAGGAVAIRAQGLDDIRQVRNAVDVPVIGLWKDGNDGVYITPTLNHALAVADAGAHIVALDGTRRHRPDQLTLTQTISRLTERHDVLIMADCGSLADALAAEEAGAHIVGTTLAGYTGERPMTSGPDWDFIDETIARIDTPVVVEGRVHTPADAAEVMRRGAFAVCVGTAITHPTTITRWFVEAIGSGA